MNCETVRKKLSPFLDGQLTENDCRRIASHLERCESCSREYDELRRLGELLLHLDTAQTPSYFWQRVERNILSEKPSVWERFSHRLIYVPVAAAVLIGLFIGNHLGRNISHQFLVTERDFLNLSALEDFPPGSFSDAYFYGWEE
jgi:anti-sigma factor (TIGR02949 family)